jgi:hypothetical protein
LKTLFALLAALPFGWGLGLVVARILMPADIGQMPALTIPVGIVIGLVFALIPFIDGRTRLVALLVGTVVTFAIDTILSR